MIYCFDIDGTICTNTNGRYEEAVVFPDMVKKINTLFDSGNIIYLYTARGSSSGINWEPLTRSQIQKWGLKIHKLFMGKPDADVYIDDRAIDALNWRMKDLK